MNLDIYELSAKALVGEQLTDEEKAKLKNYNTKYALVRYLVSEKRKAEGVNLVDFHFTPGSAFLETPTLDVVNGIIKSFSLPATPLDFGDLRWKEESHFGNPPHTSQVKRAFPD